ncbi:MAG TPA: two-component regulator propeller domain-containing protein, partial [Chitinophagaceae bacterium]|nr:two-component regulator propeller domain-containing protein [Chitinophagaceae bacterium]
MKKPLVLLLLMFCLRLVAAGQDSLVEVKGIPSKEVYDLLIDSKGYLWIAHELGITRYDGARFIHFSHPRQASLSMSGMLEDRNGRIWFHNFSGQIFFIDKGRMELLERYDHTKEQVFPKMVILQDEMIATTYNGLFIYNTSTGKHRLIKLSDRKP